MKLHRIESSGIRALGYDPGRELLWVQYDSGSIYEYAGVPEDLYRRMLAAQPHPWSRYGIEVKSYPSRMVR
ncbi:MULTISPECIES: KTSC domain-containing protein [unclassified Leifsonia]|uniref:KTSC domain-containing protein n=1 Tax=unclassified Leifsonia TaxID=2663824 RepID=UPI0006FBB66C|nr:MULTISPECIES: KTSC domain-containing protein [unclassified Leifsonia]KQX08204.1 hypothetical protein ASC59_11120 [Leifsonia sp. Root1293]KRA12486.1 hypothetical protein ASD61_11120 [Leifsonia sp. Root60]